MGRKNVKIPDPPKRQPLPKLPKIKIPEVPAPVIPNPAPTAYGPDQQQASDAERRRQSRKKGLRSTIKSRQKSVIEAQADSKLGGGGVLGG